MNRKVPKSGNVSGSSSVAPTDVRRRLAAAAEHLRSGRRAKAEALCREVLANDPAMPGALHMLGVLCAQDGRFEESIRHLHAAAAASPGDPGLRNDLGNACLAAGRIDQAVACYRDAIARRPDFAEAHFNLANALMEADRLPEAVDSYRQAARLTSGQPAILGNLGIALHRAGRYDEAVAVLEDARRRSPRAPELPYNLGLSLLAQGRAGAATEAFGTAIKLRPAMAQAHVGLGDARYESGDYKGAAEAYRRAIDVEPGFARAYTGLGAALDALDDTAGAIAAIRQALELDPTNVIGHINLGLSLRSNGDLKGAAAEFRRALEIDPGNTRALSHLGLTLPLTGQHAEAHSVFDFDNLVMKAQLDCPDGWSSSAAFNADLATFIRDHPTLIDDRPGKSTTGGQQTLEILFDDSPAIRALRREIEVNVERYISGILRGGANPHTPPPPERWRLTGWAVVLKNQGFQSPHVHPGGIVSGVYYVYIPDAVSAAGNERAGFLEFGQFLDLENGTVSGGGLDSVTVRPEAGLMVVFPSYFWHSTIPFESEEDRISIAFDAISV